MDKLDPILKEKILNNYYEKSSVSTDIINYYEDKNYFNNFQDCEKFNIPPILFTNHPEIAKRLQEKCDFDLDEFKCFINNKLNQLNISQNELAERALMPKQTLSNKMCRKSKFTIEQALALSLGMRLTIAELHEFLSILGYNRNNQSIMFVESCIEENLYDIISVNELLDLLDLPLLGSMK